MDPTVVTTTSTDDAGFVGSIWLFVFLIIFIIIIAALIIWANSGSTENGNSKGKTGPAGPPGPQGPQGPPGPPGSDALNGALYFSHLIQFPTIFYQNSGNSDVVVKLELMPDTIYTFDISVTVGSGTITPFTFLPSSPNGMTPLRYEVFVQGSNMILRFYHNETNFQQGILSVIAIPVDHNVITTTSFTPVNNFGNQPINVAQPINRYYPGQRNNNSRFRRR